MRRQRHSFPVAAGLVAGLVTPGAAPAFDCEFYQTCCQQLVEAYRESGMRGTRLSQFADTCDLHHVFDAMPGAQMLFCIDAWEAMSRAAYQHYLDGRIAFYPDACMVDPFADPDEILIPDAPPGPDDVIPED